MKRTDLSEAGRPYACGSAPNHRGMPPQAAFPFFSTPHVETSKEPLSARRSVLSSAAVSDLPTVTVCELSDDHMRSLGLTEEGQIAPRPLHLLERDPS